MQVVGFHVPVFSCPNWQGSRSTELRRARPYVVPFQISSHYHHILTNIFDSNTRIGPAVAGANARSRTPVFTNWREKKHLPSANHLQSVGNAQSVGYAASAQDEPSDHAIRFDSPKKFAQPMEPEKDPQQPRGFQQTQNMQQFQNGQPFQYMQPGQNLQFDNLANVARLLGADPSFQQVRSIHPENNKYLTNSWIVQVSFLMCYSLTTICKLLFPPVMVLSKHYRQQ